MTNATPPEDQEPEPEQADTPKGREMPTPSREQITKALLKVIRPEPKS